MNSETFDYNKSWALNEEAVRRGQNKRFKFLASNMYCEIVVGGQIGAYLFEYTDPRMVEKIKDKLKND